MSFEELKVELLFKKMQEDLIDEIIDFIGVNKSGTFQYGEGFYSLVPTGEKVRICDDEDIRRVAKENLVKIESFDFERKNHFLKMLLFKE